MSIDKTEFWIQFFDRGFPKIKREQARELSYEIARKIREIPKEECTWTIAPDWDDNYWVTSCGEDFTFNKYGPAENGMNFCSHCGKSVRINGPIENDS
jgi:hypothetical protein